MTEAEWLSASDSRDLLYPSGWRERVARGSPTLDGLDAPIPKLVANERRLMLYACGCLRLLFPQLRFSEDRRALDTAERYADNEATRDQLEEATQNCGATVASVKRLPVIRIARLSVEDVFESKRVDHPAGPRMPLYNAKRADLLRDIFGNPFRPVAFDPAWRTSTALAIANGIYDDRAFDRLPILADAIQDAGCENEDILSHLRSDGPHVKGCWALDLVLGKE